MVPAMTARDGMIAAAPRHDKIDRVQNDAETRREVDPVPAVIPVAIPVAVVVPAVPAARGAAGPTLARAATATGRGAVVAAKSLVTRDVPAGSLHPFKGPTKPPT